MSWGQFRLNLKQNLFRRAPLMIWGRTAEDVQDGLFDIPHGLVECTDLGALPIDVIAVITDPKASGSELAAVAFQTKKSHRTAPTIVPVRDDFCQGQPTFPFLSNSFVHMRIT